MFGPWIETFLWIKTLFPDFSKFKFRIPHVHFNFILLHYIYLLSLTIITSVILYGAQNMEYIDALFLASGAATQSGLNTVNLNQIYLYQQITLTIVSNMATPIFINTFVVFVRLYWFEKRFQNVVLEAQKFRRTRERSRTKTESKDDDAPDFEREERGVRGRKIVVMHPGDRTMEIAEHRQHYQHHTPKADGDGEVNEKEIDSSGNSAPSDSSDTQHGNAEGGHTDGASDHPTAEVEGTEEDDAEPHAFRRDVKFADEVPDRPHVTFDPTEHPDQLLAQRRDTDQHIAILENQRNRKDKGTLYIPGPRDFDEGKGPQEISDDVEDGLSRQRSAGQMSSAPPTRTPTRDDDEDVAQSPFRKKLTQKLSFDDAAHAYSRAKHGVVSRFKHAYTEQPTEDVKTQETTGKQSAEELHDQASLRRRGRVATFATFMTSRTGEEEDPMPYLSYNAPIGRNSAFVNLTEEQREELGGIEYRALKTLAVTLVAYFLGFHLLGIVCLVPWILRSTRYSNVVRAFGQSPLWWGFFTESSLFSDLGFTLTPDSMNSFQRAVFPLLLGSFLIIVGNTGFPCMLRLIIWILSKIIPRGSSLWEEYRFLLDHPRRCFTLLFPSGATWWLFWVLVILNGLDLLFFCVLDIGDSTVSVLPAGFQVLDGWFQAASTRTAGFAVVNLANLHPGVQVSYLIMMYISIFPIAISVRRTNVYEEKSLGVFKQQSEAEDDDSATQSYIGNHLRRQLSFDLWYVFLGLFVIAIVEGGRLANTNEYAFTIFSVLFEVVSAYGTVGLSLGYPNTDTSFSAQFHVLSKLVIIAMQIRGRHRGLPYALDKAILLPSEEQQRKEHEDGLRQMARTNTMMTARSRLSAGPSMSRNDVTDASMDSQYADADDQFVAGDHPTRRQSTMSGHSLAGESLAARERRKRIKGGFGDLIASAFSAGPSWKPSKRE